MAEPRVILTVDRNHRNLELLAQFLGKAGYQNISTSRLEDFDHVLDSREGIDLALIDLTGFDHHIWTRCDRLRAAKIPFLILSTGHAGLVRQDGIEHGARAVLAKPLASKELLGMIRSLLEEAA